jgi:hypothetical protein
MLCPSVTPWAKVGMFDDKSVEFLFHVPCHSINFLLSLFVTPWAKVGQGLDPKIAPNHTVEAILAYFSLSRTEIAQKINPNLHLFALNELFR